jgi:hypothetical protein
MQIGSHHIPNPLVAVAGLATAGALVLGGVAIASNNSPSDPTRITFAGASETPRDPSLEGQHSYEALPPSATPLTPVSPTDVPSITTTTAPQLPPPNTLCADAGMVDMYNLYIRQGWESLMPSIPGMAEMKEDCTHAAAPNQEFLVVETPPPTNSTTTPSLPEPTPTS